MAKGDFEGAIADYSEAIRLQPEHSELWNSRGLAKLAKGDIAGAIADFDEAIRLQPEYGKAIRNREIALAQLQGAAKKEPSTPAAIPDSQDPSLERIRAAQEATPLAERVEWVSETEKIRVTPTSMESARLWDDVVGKLRDEIVDLKPLIAGSNQYRALESPIERLESRLERYSDSPQRVHDEAETALDAVEWLVREGEVAEGIETRRLKKTLTDSILDIRGNTPGVLDVVEKRTAQKFSAISDDEREQLSSANEAVVPHIEDERTQEDMRQDAEVLAGQLGGRVSLEHKSAIYRLLSRLSRMIPLLTENAPGFAKKVAEGVFIAKIIEMLSRG